MGGHKRTLTKKFAGPIRLKLCVESGKKKGCLMSIPMCDGQGVRLEQTPGRWRTVTRSHRDGAGRHSSTFNSNDLGAGAPSLRREPERLNHSARSSIQGGLSGQIN